MNAKYKQLQINCTNEYKYWFWKYLIIFTLDVLFHNYSKGFHWHYLFVSCIELLLMISINMFDLTINDDNDDMPANILQLIADEWCHQAIEKHFQALLI